MHKIASLVLSLLFFGVNIIAFSQENTTEKWDMKKCIETALEKNISVSQSQLKQRTSELNYNQAKMNRLPLLNGSASQSLLEPTSSSVGLSASVNLFNGFNTEYNIKRSKLELEKQSYITEQTINDIEIAVAEAYLQVLYYSENIKTSERTLESSAEQLKLAEAKYKVGSIAKKDLTDIQAQYANNQYSLIRAQNQYEQQKLTLKQLLELSPEENFDVVEPELSPNYDMAIPSPMEVFNEACKTLPEIKNAEQQLVIDSLAMKMAKSAYYPSLSLSAGVGASGNFFDNESEWSGNKSLRMSLSVPIFNKWQTKTNVETSKINAEYNALAVESTKKSLYKEIEAACLNAKAYQNEWQALQMSAQAAQESYELAQKQFKVGSIDATSLLLAETKMIDANLALNQVHFMTLLSYIIIDHYQGKPISL